jgi:hypothetical protein
MQSSEFDGALRDAGRGIDVDDWEILTKCITGRGATMPYVRLIADMNPTTPASTSTSARPPARSASSRSATRTTRPSRPSGCRTRRLTGYRYGDACSSASASRRGDVLHRLGPDVHVVDPFPIPAHWTRWTATDYGFAVPFCHWPSPAARRTRAIYVHREIYAAGLHDHQQADLITKPASARSARPRRRRPPSSTPCTSATRRCSPSAPSRRSRRSPASTAPGASR